ncbi:hypothetical protein [Alkalicoccus chagannorensis]|uniref:hypothetical protein n=1 Tax=Alkalicoccus chagannorensis TaxID=427072 RepID=UPI0004123E8E|nr:hypothetical protein [Alkalicoccus chagannorensis]
MAKDIYYVVWRSGTFIELTPVLADDQLIHYEVELNAAEREKLEAKLQEVSDGDVMPEHIFVSPFDETKDDWEKIELGDDEDNLFHMIYNFGTPETRRRLNELYDDNRPRR